MRRVTTVVSLVFGAALCAATASAQSPAPSTQNGDSHPSVNQRLENQQDRIQAGIKDDQLTKGESTRLKADDAAIHAEEKVDRKSNGGTLTKRERKQLNRQLNRNSRRIYRARQNGKKAK